MITNRDRLAVVEAFHVSDDLRQDTTESVADGDDASPIKLRRLQRELSYGEVTPCRQMSMAFRSYISRVGASKVHRSDKS